jgi:hypothetical protein
MAAEDLYDFEVLIPRAVKDIFTGRGITAYTIEDAPEFQKTRPRVEVTFSIKGSSSPRKVLPDGSMRSSAFRGDLLIIAIAGSDATAAVAHSALRANIRDVAAGLPRDLSDGSALPHHRVNFINAGNEETGRHSEHDYTLTRFTFPVDVAIQDDAWAFL